MEGLLYKGIFALFCIIAGAGSSAKAQEVSRCFRDDWLQGERVVNFRVNGNRVTGTFAVEDGSGDDKTYEFSGTLRADTLRVVFAGGKLPDIAPAEMKSLIWTLVKTGEKEMLRIKFRGKNYISNKYEDSFADFEPCEDGFAILAKTAIKVRFAKGDNSARLPVTFNTKHERKSFLLNMKANQHIGIQAYGCGIKMFYPDKTESEELAIDTFSRRALTQSGDYLFVLNPSPYPGRCSVNFKVTN